MSYSVLIDDAWYDAVIPRRPNVAGHFWVKLVASDRTLPPRRLCILTKAASYNDTWTCIALGDKLIGPRMVEGFKTRVQAMQYAVQITPEINAKAKAMREGLTWPRVSV